MAYPEHGPMSDPLTTVVVMVNKPRVLTAEELDAMTPDERAQAFNERIVTNLDELPAEFRDRVIETGQRLTNRRDTSNSE